MAVAVRRPATRRAPVRRVIGSEQFSGWAFVTPGVVIILLFGAVPIVWSAVMSFQQNNLLSPSTPFVGTANYRKIGAFIANLANVKQARPQISQYPKISTILGNMVVSVLLGKSQPQAALTAAAQQVDQALAAG